MLKREEIFDAHAEELLAASVEVFALLDDAKMARYDTATLTAACEAVSRLANATSAFARAVIEDSRSPENN